MYWGSSYPLELMGRQCDQTISGKIQDGGLQTSNACISASRQKIDAIPTAAPMLLESSIPTRLGWILLTKTGSWKAKMAISELQIRTYTVLLVDQNFSYHIGVITRKQVKQSCICGTFCASHFRFGRTSFSQVQWYAGPKKHRYSRLNPLISCLRAQSHVIEVERSPSWICPLPVWSHSIFMSPNGRQDNGKTGIAVGISLISCLGAEIHAFEVWRPPSWIFPIPV